MPRNKMNMQKGRRDTSTKTRGVGSNTAIVESVKTIDLPPADANGYRYGGFPCDPANPGVVTQPVSNIAAAYEFYRIRSLTVKVIPIGGAFTAGSLQHCFINNPELMSTFINGNDTVKSNIITNEQNCESASVIAQTIKRYQPTRTKSRTWYSVNTILAGNDLPAFDRSVQTFYGYRVAGVTVSAALPIRLEFKVVYEFSGLGNVGQYTLQCKSIDQTASGPVVYRWVGTDPFYELRVPTDTSDGWPASVVCVSREDGEKVYLPEQQKPAK